MKWVLPPLSELCQIQYVDDDTIDNRPLLTTNCKWSYYNSLDAKETKFLSFEGGQVFVEECPTYPPHGAAVGEFVKRMLVQAGNVLDYLADTTYHAAPGARQPDACFLGSDVPHPGVGGPGAANPQGSAWPTVLLEVCYRRSLQTGINKAVMWLGAATGVQIVIVLKIYPQNAGGVAMVALRFVRGVAGPSYAVSFGTRALAANSIGAVNGLGGAQLVGVGIGGAPACAAFGLPLYQLYIPVAGATIGIPVANMPMGLPANWLVDLFQIQQRVLRVYHLLHCWSVTGFIGFGLIY